MRYEKVEPREIKYYYSNYIENENVTNFFAQKYAGDKTTTEELNLLQILISNVTKNILEKTKSTQDCIVFDPTTEDFFVTDLDSFQNQRSFFYRSDFTDFSTKWNENCLPSLHNAKLIKNRKVDTLLFDNVRQHLDEKVFNALLATAAFCQDELKNYTNVSCGFLFKFLSTQHYNAHKEKYYEQISQEYYICKQYEGQVVIANKKTVNLMPIEWNDVNIDYNP